MKIPSVSSITNSVKKGVIATMIAAPTAGALQSCESMAVVMTRDVPVYVHPIHVGPYAPPPRPYSFYQPPRPVVIVKPAPPPKPHVGPQPPHTQTPPPPKTHRNSHGDTYQRGGRR